MWTFLSPLFPFPTAWSRCQPYDVFIEKSKIGKAAGDFIMHRECGTLVELNAAAGRAVGKMKATITQRFSFPPAGGGGGASADGGVPSSLEPVQFDVDCDCRFHFFCLKDGAGEWRVKYVKLIYEKDKVVPVDGTRAPAFRKEVLDQYPEGYKYLGAAQRMLGHGIDDALPTPHDHVLWLDLYEKMEEWLDGRPDVYLLSVAHEDKKNGSARNGHHHVAEGQERDYGRNGAVGNGLKQPKSEYVG